MFPRSPRTSAPSRVALVRTLESLECRVTPAGLTQTNTTATIVTEAFTNTPRVVELADTRVLGAGLSSGTSFPLYLGTKVNLLIPGPYDPNSPAVLAAIDEAKLAYTPPRNSWSRVH